MHVSGRRRALWVTAAGSVLALVGWTLGHLVLAATPEPGSSADPLVSRSYVDQLVRWQVLSLPRGHRLVAEAGVELILRGGQASVQASPNGGLADITEGTDLQQGDQVPPNHLLVIARSDGRGILAAADSIVLIRGIYNIVQP